MTDKILLGFEVGTAEKVYLTPAHTVVTGMTQLSGKTTCLEALVQRGDITAVAFLTKRGESGFQNQREIQPYFKEQKRGALIDWQYVEAILEATMGEKMKFERSWIIDMCQGKAARRRDDISIPPAHSLQEVYVNIQTAQASPATRGLDLSVYTNLAAYFDIILPEIAKYRFADKLTLEKGFNVLNLVGMANEMQQLIIESVLSYIMAHLKNVVVVLPEAHKFIPQGSKTPVKNTALRFIKEGAVLGNLLWIDTQETTSVDKAILKQCSNWIMGYQQEKNEVANVRENVGKVIKEEQITSLKLGHFMALIQQRLFHVYVLPAGISESMGKEVAMGRERPQLVKDILEANRKKEALMREAVESAVDKVELEKLRRERDELKSAVNSMKESTDNAIRQMKNQLESLHGDVVLDLKKKLDNAENKMRGLKEENDKLREKSEQKDVDRKTLEELESKNKSLQKQLEGFDAFKTSFVKVFGSFQTMGNQSPAQAQISESAEVSLTHVVPKMEVTVVRQLKKIEVDTSQTRGQVFYLYAMGKLNGFPFSVTELGKRLEAEGWSRSAPPNLKSYLEDMVRWGFLEYAAAGYRKDYRVRMPVDEAKQKGLITFREEVKK